MVQSGIPSFDTVKATKGSPQYKSGNSSLNAIQASQLLRDQLKRRIGSGNFDQLTSGRFEKEQSGLILLLDTYLSTLSVNSKVDLSKFALSIKFLGFADVLISTLVFALRTSKQVETDLSLNHCSMESLCNLMRAIMRDMTAENLLQRDYRTSEHAFTLEMWGSLNLYLEEVVERSGTLKGGDKAKLKSLLIVAALNLEIESFRKIESIQSIITYIQDREVQESFLDLTFICQKQSLRTVTSNIQMPTSPMFLFKNAIKQARITQSSSPLSVEKTRLTLEKAIEWVQGPSRIDEAGLSSTSNHFRSQHQSSSFGLDGGESSEEPDQKGDDEIPQEESVSSEAKRRYGILQKGSNLVRSLASAFSSRGTHKRNFSDVSATSKGSTSSPAQSPILSSNVQGEKAAFTTQDGISRSAFSTLSARFLGSGFRSDEPTLESAIKPMPSGLKSRLTSKRLRTVSPETRKSRESTGLEGQAQAQQLRSSSIPPETATSTMARSQVSQPQRIGEAPTNAVKSDPHASRATQHSAGSGEMKENERERSDSDRSRDRSEDAGDEIGRGAEVSVRGDQRIEGMEEEIEEVLGNVKSNLRKTLYDVLKKNPDPEELEVEYQTIMAPFKNFLGSSRATSTKRAPTPSTSSIGTQTGNLGSSGTKNDSSILPTKNVRGRSVEQGSTVLSRSSTPTITQGRSIRSASPNGNPAISTRHGNGRSTSEPLSSVVADPETAGSSQVPSSLPVANLVEGDRRRSDRAGSEPIITPSVSPEVQTPANIGKSFDEFGNARAEPDEGNQSGSERDFSVPRNDGVDAALRSGEENEGVGNDDREGEDFNGGAREKNNADEVSRIINKAAATRIEDEGNVEGNGGGAAREKGKGPSSNVDAELANQNQPERRSKSPSPGIVRGEQAPADDPPSGSNRPQVETDPQENDDSPAKNPNEDAGLQDKAHGSASKSSSPNQAVPSQQPPPPRTEPESSNAADKINNVSSINAQAQIAAQDAPQPARENQDGGSKSPEAMQVDPQQLQGANNGKERAVSAPPESASGMASLWEQFRSRGKLIAPFNAADLNQEGTGVKKGDGSVFASRKGLINLLSHHRRMDVDGEEHYFLIRAPAPAHGDLSADSSASKASDADADGDLRMGDPGPAIEEGQAGGVEVDGHRAEMGMGGDEVMLEGADPVNEVMESLTALFLGNQ